MNKYTSLFLLMFLALSFSAQDLNLQGKWKVNCALEKKKNESTFHVCDFCPTTILNNNAAIVEDFNIEIGESAIKFTTEEMKFEVPYEWDKTTYTIRFKYIQKDYVFKAMVVSDPQVQVLVAETGEVLYLKKLL